MVTVTTESSEVMATTVGYFADVGGEEDGDMPFSPRYISSFIYQG